MHLKLNEQHILPDVFLGRLRESPKALAYRQFIPDRPPPPGAGGGVAPEGRWVDYSWEEVARGVGRWQEALRREGLATGDRVGLCVRNRLEWVLFDQAALGLGLVVVPLFYNDRPDNMAYCLADAGARVLLLEDGALWPAMRAELPGMRRVVCLANAPAGDPKAVTAGQWLPAEGPAPARGPARPEDLATLVYTSGTTGRPKGVMLTHGNIVSDLIALIAAVPELLDRPHRFLSFLPLSHMFERTVGYYIPMCLGDEVQVVYARSVLDLPHDLMSQRPTILVSVPRIFERVYGKIEEGLTRAARRRLFNHAVDIGWRRYRGEALRLMQRFWHRPLDALVGRKLRARFGGRLQYVLIGGAAMAPHLFRIFTGLGLRFIHGYGLTETSPVLCASRIGERDPTSVGRAVPGVEVRIAENGELLARGPIIMKGYWNKPEATAAAIDAEGWFHTGDLAEWRDGLLYIRGRLKEIVVLSNGEKVAQADVEQAILQDTIFEQAMVIGEGRAHLGLLVVSKNTDARDLCARANRLLHAFPGYVRIRHIARLAEPWTVENGLITPTLKLKRGEIEKRYVAEIEEMFRRTDACRE